MPFQLNYDDNLGLADEGSRTTLNPQPVIPFALDNGANIVTRTIIPYIWQEDVVPGTSQSGFGDVLASAWYSRTTEANLTWGVGPVVRFPTWSDVSSETWAAGVTAIALQQTGPWTFGALANHLWDLEDDPKAPTNATFVQLFVAYSTEGAWTYSLLAAAFAAAMAATPAWAQFADDNLDALVDAREIPVTVDNFIRAATDIEFGKYGALSGGVNKFYHFRDMMPVDNQTTISANRDTLYSTAIVDISEGATFTLPDAGNRYISAMVINQDHYLNEVFHGGGTYALDMDTFDTPYVAVYLRILVDANDPVDMAAVHAIQDRMSIEAASSEPFIVPPYDEESYTGLVTASVGVGAYLANSFRMFGKKENVDPVRHFIGTAGGWGGLPEDEALYLGIAPNLPVGEYRIEVPAEVPVKDFWSVSVYDANRYFAPNALGAYVTNSVSGTYNEDGTMPALSEIRDAVERDWRASRRAALDAALSAGTAE